MGQKIDKEVFDKFFKESYCTVEYETSDSYCDFEAAVQEAMDDLNPEILDAVMDVTEAQEDGDEITEVYWDTQRELLHDFLLRLYDEVISTWK